MKPLFLLAALAVAFVFTGCKREGCTQSNALNFDSKAKKDDGTCTYSKVTFYAWTETFFGTTGPFEVVKIDLSVNNVPVGTIEPVVVYFFGPGNCNSAGTLTYQLEHSDPHNWNAVLHGANGEIGHSSGVVSSVRGTDCVMIELY